MVLESSGVLEVAVRAVADKDGSVPSIGKPLALRITTADGTADGKMRCWLTSIV